MIRDGWLSTYGGTLDADIVEFAGGGTVDGDLIIGGVPVLNAEVEYFEVNIQEWEDELVFDIIPNDPGHLIPQDVHHGASYSK